MGITFNGTSVDTVKYNGTNLTKVTYNGTVVWEDKIPLCFTANTANSTIAMGVSGTPTLNQNFSYSTDKITWNTFTPGTTTVTLDNVGDKVYFKGDNPNGVSESDYSKYYAFVMTGSIAASGNVMSLIDNGACTTTTIPNAYCFYNLFSGCTSLTTAPALPATTLTGYCYSNMFYNCTSLTNAPTLPATILAIHCYQNMFQYCTSLTNAPTLPATTLSSSCYSQMFSGCTSLTTAPALPATVLVQGCYEYMFYNCTSLTNAPTLPATTLDDYCYEYMFSGCTSLTSVPALPATTLVYGCYKSMFTGCTALYVSDSATTEATHTWRIPTSGTFTNTTTYNQSGMFTNCLGTRSTNAMSGANGGSHTYYTQNAPV